MDALILAGGMAPDDLKDKADSGERGMIDIAGRPMIAYLVAALRGVPQVGRIAVVGGPRTLEAVAKLESNFVPVEAGDKMVKNLLLGLRTLNAPSALVCGCDVPLVTSQTFAEMLDALEQRGLQAIYPIARREDCEAQFPGGQRTYARLKDGQWTGGNAVVVPSSVVERLEKLTDAAYNARKNPIALAKMLGPDFILRTMFRQLSVSYIEQHMTRVLGVPTGAVIMRDTSIAFDVDKMPDYDVVLERLKGAK